MSVLVTNLCWSEWQVSVVILEKDYLNEMYSEIAL